MQLPLLATLVATLASLGSSAPLNERTDLQVLGERIVYNPHITSPTKSSVWKVGSKQTVTWSTKGIPASLKNATSTLYLGYKDAGSPNEHLDVTLADGFPLMAHKIDFTVPKGLKERKNYIVVLLGDSGNASPKFTIKK
ncbi:hypothetical protein BDZ90DRAFT_230362 [Jaminaea rosea]|uniref:Yeast cell wall synthesis Kre9/Knh1-like N-terminal domain-containing protein n=1 Tax=Jaminaea rosea TaxID=1569628 RepID=A0A316UW90_9BASI|nr:hypothetical protein BDZ90DRAFT_230362 [Jaminaea rosea]PWN29492.1 hypothetical protein BDZ90DRAFT_230362 [Jaminaea rosea]